jgi:acetoin utilization deacetylase AcuC-like enzyme
MASIRFVGNSWGKKHSNGRFHPESPQRIEVMENWIKNQTNETISYEIMEEKASKDDILSVHTEEYHQLIEKTRNYEGHFYFNADTGANNYSYDAATQAVYIGKKALWESTRDESIFCLVRPPGHHATRFAPQGFCLFNNIAISTELAIREKKYNRIAIIDFDQHFGNGTSYIHETNPNILYISTHASPTISYPGCGFVDEIGKGEGKGFNVPIPLGYRASEGDLKLVFDEIIDPIISKFKPEFLAISAGFDAFERDPIGVLGVTMKGFEYIGQQLKLIADKLNIPYAHFLEGGYNINFLPNLLSAYITPFISEIDEYKKVNISLQPNSETTSTIQRSKSLLDEFWSFKS